MTVREAREILSIYGDYDANSLRKIYIDLVKEFHPDAHPDIDRVFMQKINEAYELLSKSLKNNKIDYQSYCNKKIEELRNKYLVNVTGKTYDLQIISKIENEIKSLENDSTLKENISKFDEAYNNKDRVIFLTVLRFREDRLNLLKKDVIYDEQSKRNYDLFCDTIGEIKNVYLIENMCRNYRMNNKIMDNYYVNDIYLAAQKDYLIEKYLNYPLDSDKIFDDKYKEIKNIIIDFINSCNNNLHINSFELQVIALEYNIEFNINKFKREAFYSIINESYFVKYPRIKSIIEKEINKIKNYRLGNIYNVYSRLKYSIKNVIIENIEKKLQDVINRFKEMYPNSFIYINDKVNNIYNDIINSLDINPLVIDNNDYIKKMELDIIKCLAGYDSLNKQREFLINQISTFDLSESDKAVISKLENAKNYDELEDAIKYATIVANNASKIHDDNSNKRHKRERAAFIKGKLSVKIQFSNSYSEEEKKKISSMIDDVIKQYLDDKIFSIEPLVDINFVDYEDDLRIINNIINQKSETKDNNVEKPKANNSRTSRSEQKDEEEIFGPINNIFTNRDNQSKNEYIKRIYNMIMRRYDTSNFLDKATKDDILLHVMKIIDNHEYYSINEISRLLGVEFKNYGADMEIIYGIMNDNYNNKRR